jgi:hypothetical protein
MFKYKPVSNHFCSREGGKEITNYVQEFGLYSTPHLIFPITKRETLPLASSPSSLNRPEAELLDEIQTKVLRVSFLVIPTHLYSFTLRFLFLQTHTTLLCISSNSRNLLHISTVQLLFTVKEKGGNLKENHTPFSMVSEIYRETSSLRTLKQRWASTLANRLNARH